MFELFSFHRNKKHVNKYENLCKNKDFCKIVMPSEETKILEFNQNQISFKPLFIAYDDLECLIEKFDGC